MLFDLFRESGLGFVLQSGGSENRASRGVSSSCKSMLASISRCPDWGVCFAIGVLKIVRIGRILEFVEIRFALFAIEVFVLGFFLLALHAWVHVRQT